MKRTRICLLCLVLAAAARAGEFINLDFNSPDMSRAETNFYGMIMVPPEDAIRGWSVQFDWPAGQNPEPLPRVVGTTQAGAPFGLHLFYLPPADAPYSLRVESYWRWPDVLRPPMHLYQAGTVPSNALRLELRVGNPPLPAKEGMSVFLDGERQESYAIDVSRCAGQEVKLEFYFPAGEHQYHILDIYGFVPIPEPSTWALAALGGAALWVGRRRRRDEG